VHRLRCPHLQLRGSAGIFHRFPIAPACRRPMHARTQFEKNKNSSPANLLVRASTKVKRAERVGLFTTSFEERETPPIPLRNVFPA